MRSESELRALTQQSREDGLRAIFAQYSGYVYAIVWNHIRTVGTREDAEEAVSDVFADLFRDFDRIEEGKLGSYIRTLAKRTAVDLFRRLAARPEVTLGEDETWQEAVSGENIEADHDRTVLRETLLRCIASLGEPDASILILRYFYDCTSAEIGQKLGMNRITVRSRLSRARDKLKKLLADEDITP